MNGDNLFIIISTALVMLMVPAIGLLYGGMVRRKNVISVISLSIIALAVTSLQWIIIGYSLVFSETFLGLLGTLKYFGLNNISLKEYSYVAFQLMFAAVTLALITSAVVERIKLSSFLLFSALWLTFVYAPIAHWVWNENGILAKLGMLDFAGGLVVHANAGFAALALALVIGKRYGFLNYTFLPNNIPMAIIGGMLLWFGWFGFNAGSALEANYIASNALLSTNTAAAAGALGWMLVNWLKEGKVSSLGIISGIIAGLVAITPGAGYVKPIFAIIIGFISGIICYYAMNYRIKRGIDESLDCFSIHGIAGVWGAIATGIFASINSSGLILGNYTQPVIQLIGTIIGITYSFVVTYVIAYFLHRTIGLRVKREEEYVGLDIAKHGEQAYG